MILSIFQSIAAHLTTDFWVMLIVHFFILLYMRYRISRRKKELEKEKAELYIEVLDLTAKLDYYKRELSQSKRSQHAK